MKKNQEHNLYQEQYRALVNTVHEAKKQLNDAVEAVIKKQGVIALYPEGADKKTAIQDCEEAKRKMICAIGFYDARRQERIDYFKQNFEHLEGWADGSNEGTSHDIVETAYYYFYNN